MRSIRLAGLFVALSALASFGCGTPAPQATIAYSDGLADGARKVPLYGSCDDCGPNRGCSIRCEPDTIYSPAHCTQSCEPFGSECVECSAWLMLFCPDHESTCEQYADRQPGCSSYTDAKSDPNNCGRCDTNCATCTNSQCACEVNGAIVNLNVDRENCGACGHACAVNEICAIGECQEPY